MSHRMRMSPRIRSLGSRLQLHRLWFQSLPVQVQQSPQRCPPKSRLLRLPLQNPRNQNHHPLHQRMHLHLRALRRHMRSLYCRLHTRLSPVPNIIVKASTSTSITLSILSRSLFPEFFMAVTFLQPAMIAYTHILRIVPSHTPSFIDFVC